MIAQWKAASPKFSVLLLDIVAFSAIGTDVVLAGSLATVKRSDHSHDDFLLCEVWLADATQG
jgi:hypothetical protein